MFAQLAKSKGVAMTLCVARLAIVVTGTYVMARMPVLQENLDRLRQLR